MPGRRAAARLLRGWLRSGAWPWIEMLAIRPDQMRNFSEAALKQFEDMMVVHLNKFFPQRTKAAGEPTVRKFIRYGVQRAASYNIKAKRAVSRYIDLMMSFGADFDKSKRLPWAGEILRTRNSPEVRISTLLRNADRYLKGA